MQDIIKHLSFKPRLKFIIKLRLSENEDDIGQDLCEHVRLWSFTDLEQFQHSYSTQTTPVGSPRGWSLLPSAVLSGAYSLHGTNSVHCEVAMCLLTT